MRADYDVVIIGDSYSARWAALNATRQYARVALVLQSQASELAFPATMQALADLVASAQDDVPPFTRVHELNQWIQLQNSAALKGLGLKRLSQLGVDIIREPGCFIETSTKTPIFAVQRRQLRSRRYLLALAPEPLHTHTKTDRYHSLKTFLAALEQQQQPGNVMLECHHAWVLPLGQILNRLGYAVTLSYEESLLPFEDPEVNFLVQCALESQGVRLHRALDTNNCENDQFYFDSQSYLALETLDLKQVGLQVDSTQNELNLRIMPDLCTENHHVYIATTPSTQFSPIAVIQHRTAIALNNLLFNLHSHVDLESVSQAIPIGMGLCRRGLTEVQARRRYGDVDVMTRSIETGKQSLFCKLVVSSQSDILGMHLLGLPGYQSQALLQQIFMNKLLVHRLDELQISHPIVQQILHDFAHRWRQIKFPKSRDRRERYFRAKRKRFS